MQPIGIPPYEAQTPLTDNANRLTPDAHRSLLQVYNSAVLIPVSTAAGNLVTQLPFAKQNQGQKRTYIKSTNDGNAATFQPSGTDKILGPSAPSLVTQYSRVTFQSDGAGNWYVIG